MVLQFGDPHEEERREQKMKFLLGVEDYSLTGKSEDILPWHLEGILRRMGDKNPEYNAVVFDYFGGNLLFMGFSGYGRIEFKAASIVYDATKDKKSPLTLNLVLDDSYLEPLTMQFHCRGKPNFMITYKDSDQHLLHPTKIEDKEYLDGRDATLNIRKGLLNRVHLFIYPHSRFLYRDSKEVEALDEKVREEWKGKCFGKDSWAFYRLPVADGYLIKR